jgi:hypothetical protein
MCAPAELAEPAIPTTPSSQPQTPEVPQHHSMTMMKERWEGDKREAHLFVLIVVGLVALIDLRQFLETLLHTVFELLELSLLDLDLKSMMDGFVMSLTCWQSGQTYLGNHGSPNFSLALGELSHALLALLCK